MVRELWPKTWFVHVFQMNIILNEDLILTHCENYWTTTRFLKFYSIQYNSIVSANYGKHTKRHLQLSNQYSCTN